MNPTITTNTTNTNNPYLVSSSPVWQDFNSATKSLNGIISTPDPYMSLFQNQLSANALNTDNAIASATAATGRQKVQANQREQQLEAGLNTAAEKTGLQPNSAYQMQVIDDARSRFRTQFNLIDQTEKIAIAKAKAAQMSGDVAVLKEQLNYINDLRKQKADALYKENQLAWEKEKFNRQMALQYSKASRSTGSQKNDIAEAVLRFKDQMASKDWYGADPAEYNAYKNYIRETYGAQAVLDLNKALLDEGIEVDLTGDGIGGNM